MTIDPASPERRRIRRRSSQKRSTFFRQYFYTLGAIACVLVALALFFAPVAENIAAGLEFLSVVSLLAAAGLLFLGWRKRWLHNPARWDRQCPECGDGDLKRVHRSAVQKLPDKAGFPLRRYMCANCGWKGYRVNERHVP